MQARDPIPHFRKYVLDEGILTEDNLKSIEAEVIQEVEESVQYADESPKPVRPMARCCQPKHLPQHFPAFAMLSSCLAAANCGVQVQKAVHGCAGEGAAAGECVRRPQGLWHRAGREVQVPESRVPLGQRCRVVRAACCTLERGQGGARGISDALL